MSSAPTSESRLTLANGRFELLRQLGEGSYGVVYEAFDRAAGLTVAVKVLQRASADSVLHFKREFRALHELSHRNLVQLRELLFSDGQWLLSMELVEGTDFLSYVRPGHRADNHNGSEADIARLRASLTQLAQGLGALHAAELVHRDLKPSNVRITPSGRVVILDFGLVTALGGLQQSTAHGVVGTAAYMAPEQAACDEVGPASDWYAVGVMLFEALTGTLPVSGSPLQVLLAKQRELTIGPRDLVPHVPQDLHQLCVELIRRDGEHRMRAAAVLSEERSHSIFPQHSIAPPGASSRTLATELVGRAREVTLLEQAFEATRAGGLSVAVVSGESGIGKSRLLSHFAEKLSLEQEVTVLSSRCCEAETIPYKAVDGLIDGLASVLRKLPRDVCRALLPRRTGLLPLVFPVLARVGAIAQAGSGVSAAHDKTALRSLVFGTLRELLINLCNLQRMLIVIDDAQWADPESVSLLAELVRLPEPPAALVVFATRPRAEVPQEVRELIDHALDASARQALIPLGPLAPEHARELAVRLWPAARAGGGAARLAAESEGHPLVLELMARSAEPASDGPPTFERALESILRALSPVERELLDACSLTGAPVPRASLPELLGGATASHLDSAVGALKVKRLMRTVSFAGMRCLEPVHDRIVRAVVSSISEARARSLHAQLGAALERVPQIDRERVATHYERAGQAKVAARHAVLAGDAACDSLAFRKAARMYRWALSLDGELSASRQLRSKLAECLACAGQCSDAADVLLAIADGAPPSEALEARRRAAVLLIQSGRVEEGLAAATLVLRWLGLTMPQSNAHALRVAAYYWFRTQLRGERVTERNATEVSHDELIRIDILGSLSGVLGPARGVLAVALQAQHYLRALNAGEPSRLALASAHRAMGLYFRGKHDAMTKQIAAAEALLTRAPSQEVEATLCHAKSFERLAQGDPQGALAALMDAEQALERTTGQTWLRYITRMSRLRLGFTLGRYEMVLSSFPEMMRELSEQQDPFARVVNLMSVAFPYYVCGGRLDLARRSIEQCRALQNTHVIEASLPTLEYLIARLSGQPVDLDAYLAWRQDFLERFRWLGEPALTPIHAIGFFASLELARKVGSDERKRHLKEAERIAANLGDYRRAKASCFYSPLLPAVLCEAKGDRDGAIAAYAEAERLANARGYGGTLSGAARVRRGQLLGGSEGEALVTMVLDDMRAQGVQRPWLVMEMKFPGMFSLPAGELGAERESIGWGRQEENA